MLSQLLQRFSRKKDIQKAQHEYLILASNTVYIFMGDSEGNAIFNLIQLLDYVPEISQIVKCAERLNTQKVAIIAIGLPRVYGCGDEIKYLITLENGFRLNLHLEYISWANGKCVPVSVKFRYKETHPNYPDIINNFYYSVPIKVDKKDATFLTFEIIQDWLNIYLVNGQKYHSH